MCHGAVSEDGEHEGKGQGEGQDQSKERLGLGLRPPPGVQALELVCALQTRPDRDAVAAITRADLQLGNLMRCSKHCHVAVLAADHMRRQGLPIPLPHGICASWWLTELDEG